SSCKQHAKEEERETKSNRLVAWGMWVVVLVGLAACSDTTSPAATPPRQDYTLGVEEAEAVNGSADAETLAAQGSPGKISDANALNGTAYKFMRNGDELVWKKNLTAGTYEVFVTARGELYGSEAPKLAVTIGSTTVSKGFNSTSYQQVSYGTFTAQQGDILKVSFINDSYGGSVDKDRNVIFSHTWLKASSTTSPTNPSPTEPAPIAPSPTEPSAPATGDVFNTTYTVSNADFLNPERGFQDVRWISNDPNHKANADFSKTRANGYSIARTHVGLDEFKDKPISEARLEEIRIAWGNARAAGVKVMPVFSYNFPGFPGTDSTSDRSDAPLNIVKGHLDQLKPIFEEYGDVLAVLEGGFVGEWGEWHSSTNNLDEEPARSEVYNKILDVLPKNRMMTIRYVTQLRELPGSKVNEETAHNESKAARTGLINLAYQTDNTNLGTYSPKTEIEPNKQYLDESSKFIAVGGEASGSKLAEGEGFYSNCKNAQEEFARFHFSFFNPNPSARAIKLWKSEGCYDMIDKSFGYRLELKTSAIQKEVKAGAALGVSFVVNNVGYAAPFNPRGLAVVLRNQSTGTTYTLNILQDRSSTLDPRMWYRESGDITVSASPTVPSNVPAGTYDVLLSLHDPAGNLASRPEYSIRFANENVWEDATGLNLLVKGVKVTN
ncbi:MAG: DUF4832 domain-containing protein, partial [Trueperaceae bacterium]